MEAIKTKMDLDLITIRLASNSDYNAVLDINRNVYDNFDYLPACFKIWSHDPNCYHFVEEYQGKIIAYTACYFNDKTCMNQYTALAERIHPQFKGSGVFEKLREYAQVYMMNLAPPGKFGVRKMIIATPNMIKTIESDNTVATVMYMSVTRYVISAIHLMENINKLVNKKDNSKAMHLTNEKAIAMVTSEKSVTNLQSYAPFILAGTVMVYKVNTYNLRLIVSQNHSLISLDGNGVCIAISTHINHVITDNYIRLDIYYHGEAELDLWACHAIKHLQHALKVLPMDKLLRIVIYTPDELVSEAVVDFLKPVFGERFWGADMHIIPKRICFEKIYHTDGL